MADGQDDRAGGADRLEGAARCCYLHGSGARGCRATDCKVVRCADNMDRQHREHRGDIHVRSQGRVVLRSVADPMARRGEATRPLLQRVDIVIFVTVGSQMPFDRLIRAADEWAGKGRDHEVLAQVGESTYVPRHLRAVRVMSPFEFRAAVAKSGVVVAHAGMGSVLTAMEFGKPLVVMPRRGSLRETRNDHQVATARWLQTKAGIRVAMTEGEISDAIDLALGGGCEAKDVSPYASEELLTALRKFIGAESIIS